MIEKGTNWFLCLYNVSSELTLPIAKMHQLTKLPD